MVAMLPVWLRVLLRGLLPGLLLLLPWHLLRAHEVPARVQVRTIVHADANRIRVLVRAPFGAMRDVDVPTREGGLLDVPRSGAMLADAAELWIARGVRFRDGDQWLAAPRVLSVRAALPSDRSLDDDRSFEAMVSAVQQSPLPMGTDVRPDQLLMDVLLEVAITAPVQNLVMVPSWAHLGVRTTTLVRYQPIDGPERLYQLNGVHAPLHLAPGWWYAASRFARSGMQHLFGGLDHLLFVLCLVLPFRAWRPLVGVVTAFTVAHSLTLMAAALGYAPTALWFPPLVELLIALSIVYMAIENIVGARIERRWRMAFAFGLVHGFGFAGALREQLSFAGGHLLTSLAAFNVGVEVAQLLLLAVLLPVLHWLFTRVVAERMGIIIASAFVTHEAWHWTLDRGAELRAYRFAMPVFDAPFALAVVQALMGVVVVTGVAWGTGALMARLTGTPRANAVATALLAAVCVGSLAAPPPLRAQPIAARSAQTTMRGVYTAEQAVKGKEVFHGACLGCHTTASHTGAAFALRWFGKPLGELYDYVSQLMPKSGPGTLTEDEYVWVIAYILKLNGMPAGSTELHADPAWLRSVRVDSTTKAAVRAPAAHPPAADSRLMSASRFLSRASSVRPVEFR